MTTYREAFPDFGELDTEIQIPAGFEDTSWNNDACPSWQHARLQLRLHIDYADPARSEINPEGEDYARFCVSSLDTDCVSIDSDAPFHAAKTWDEALAYIIAQAFVAELRSQLTPEEFAQVRRENAEPEYATSHACASHDVLDANMVMDAAFRDLGLSTENLGEDTRGTALWNAAWEIAKKRHLTAEPVGPGLTAAGWDKQHTGGGCMAWERPAENGYIWLTNEGTALEGDRDAAEWYVGRYNAALEGEASIGAVTFAEALAAVDKLPDPGARLIVAHDLADLLEEFKG